MSRQTTQILVEATITKVKDLKGNEYPFTVEPFDDADIEVTLNNSPFMYQVLDSNGVPVEYELQNGVIYLKSPTVADEDIDNVEAFLTLIKEGE